MQLRACEAKPSPYPPFEIPCLLAVTRRSRSKNPSHVQRACNCTIVPHAVKETTTNFKIRASISRFQIQWQVITRPKFGKLLRRVSEFKFCKFALSSQIRVGQILKFHERVISALILVASFARPKISSQFLRVSEILKFAKIVFRNLKFCFFVKGEEA